MRERGESSSGSLDGAAERDCNPHSPWRATRSYSSTASHRKRDIVFDGWRARIIVCLLGVGILISLSPGSIPRLSEIGVDSRVLAFTLGVSLLTGIIFGLLPALQASNPNLNETLKEGGRSSVEGTRGGRLRNVLAATEVALALVLLIGAGLMARSFLRLRM